MPVPFEEDYHTDLRKVKPRVERQSDTEVSCRTTTFDKESIYVNLFNYMFPKAEISELICSYLNHLDLSKMQALS